MPASIDEKMVKDCLNGKSGSYKALYEKYKVSMFILCQRYAADRMEAEDFLQNGFIKVFRDLDQFDPGKGTLKGWIRKVFTNTIFQHFRKRRILISAAPIEDYAEHYAEGENVVAEMTARELTGFIQKLPQGYRTIFNMFVIDGYSHQEIADKLNITANTSKSQLHKAKSLLRRQLAGLFSHNTIYEP